MRVLISPEDEHLLSEYKWHLTDKGYIARMDRAGRPRLLGLHRQIMGDPPGMVVDHINGDRADNRRENLRVCTHAENMRNSRMRRHNKLGVKGVYEDRRRQNSFHAQIRAGGRKVYLGSFRSADEAKAAYDAAAIRLHGEFARLS